MTSVTLRHSDGVLFDINLPDDLNALLQKAAKSYDNPAQAEALLKQAYELDNQQLSIYLALYKFYAYQNRMGEAEQAVYQGLELAASQGNFSKNWQDLNSQSTDWSKPSGAKRFYLYSLKALAFIYLRQDKRDDALKVLAKLQELDPNDEVGGSVVANLATGS
ncbi:MAG: hypothetical protein AB4206_05035 [Xenococcaceae cyanobacterium]